MFDIIGFIVWGLIIGALARLIKPGRQNLTILATLGLGLVGSVIGGLLASLIGTGEHLRAGLPRCGLRPDRIGPADRHGRGRDRRPQARRCT